MHFYWASWYTKQGNKGIVSDMPGSNTSAFVHFVVLQGRESPS